MKKTVSSKVYDHIVERILNGELKPGDLIVRRELADQLGVSVSPVGEAMLQLELEGLIKTRPRKGSYINTMSRDELTDQMLVRLAIESQASRLYCGDKIVEHFDRLMRLAKSLDRTDHKSIDYAVKDTNFHRELVCLTGSKGLLEIYDKVMRRGLLLSTYANFVPKSSKRGNHCELLEQLKTADPDQAETAIRINICGKKKKFNLEQEKQEKSRSNPGKRLYESMKRVVKKSGK